MARTNDSSAHRHAKPLPVLSMAALDQLVRLHSETGEATRLLLLLRSSVHVASAFLLMGTCVLLLGGGATMAQNFFWAVLMLTGVAALLYSYIQNTAAAFDRAPVSEAARNLRAIYFYLGLAWGAGAFLAVPRDLPVLQATLFAAVPALALALIANDLAGLAAFLAPAGLLTVWAAFVRAWPDAGLDAILIPFLQWGLFLGTILRRRTTIPAGLALR